MGKKKKHQQVSNAEPIKDILERRIDKEIPVLEGKRNKLMQEAKQKLSEKKGIGKFLTKISYGKKISEIDRAIKRRKQYGSNKVEIGLMKQRVEMNRVKKDINKSKSEVVEAIKPITSKDLFG
ncbi:MAG: hypothetical protein ACFFG0_07965 [Candidatus Thorarchaeota archaeon]